MPQIADQTYLQNEQYQNATNLDARINLHKNFSTNAYGLPRWLYDQCQILPGSLVLEVGAGSGNIWRENADRAPRDWRILLTDFSPGMIKQTRDTLAGILPHARFAVADAQELPLPDATFDAVVANFMLYHVPDRNQAIGEFRRVLKPGGTLYAATNGNDHLRRIHELIGQFDPAIELWGDPATSGFSLEDGGEQLAAHFSHVTLHRYDDAIVVADAAPLVHYIASFTPLSGEQRAALHAFIAGEIAQGGGTLRIAKAPGLFVAST